MVIRFGEEDHSGEVPFSPCHEKGTVTLDVNIDYLSKAVPAKILHCSYSLPDPFTSCSFEGN